MIRLQRLNEILGLIKENFTNVYKDCCILLDKFMIKSHLEYFNSVCHRRRKINIEKIEKVQNTTKLIHGFQKLNYDE